MSEQTPNLSNPTQIKELSASYQHFLQAAQEVPATEVTPLRADPILAYDNVKTAYKNLFTEANLEALRKKGISEERIALMQQTPEIAQAVIYAHFEAERAELRAPTKTAAKITRAAQLRKAHLLLAKALVLFQLLKDNEVAQIAKGSGSGVDLAKDCTMLAELFTRNESSLKNKIPTTPELLTEMSTIGNNLLATIRPTGAAPSAVDAPEVWRAAQDIRDRLWTLLDQRYDLMASAGIELVGRRKVKQLIPPLQSRAAPAKK